MTQTMSSLLLPFVVLFIKLKHGAKPHRLGLEFLKDVCIRTLPVVNNRNSFQMGLSKRTFGLFLSRKTGEVLPSGMAGSWSLRSSVMCAGGWLLLFRPSFPLLVAGGFP